MDLGIDIGRLVSAGAKRAARDFTIQRELRPGDLALLATNRSTEPLEIKKLGERHHAIARLLAEGLTNEAAAHAVGMQPARISALKKSPAFAELILHYRSVVDSKFADFSERLAGLGKEALLELHERLEDKPEDFTNGQLLDVVKTMADRTGFGPSSKTEVDVNVNLADRLNVARQRAKEAALGISRSDVIDAEVIPSTERIANDY